MRQILQIGAQNTAMNFEININIKTILKFLQYTEGQRPWTRLFLEVLEVAARIGTHRRCFLGDNPLGTISSPKALRKCLWWSHFLIKTQDQD